MISQPHSALPLDRPPRVVIIGSGFAGLSAARKLRKAPVEIKLISRTTHHLFQPLLYQLATGILSEGEIAPTTRVILRKQKNTKVLLGEVTNIDLDKQIVTSDTLGHHYDTAYDALIIAAGATQSYFGNNHFAEFAPGMKTIDDALELRGRIISAFEQAERSCDQATREKLLTFTIIGAGPTGVEMAGQVAELALHTLKDAYRNIDPINARVILIDTAETVLPTLDKKLGRKAAEKLKCMGVDIRLHTTVLNVDHDGVVVKGPNGVEYRIESQTKIWSAGVAASPLGQLLSQQSLVELDQAGRVNVNTDLTLPGHPYVFVIGDMAHIPGVPGVAQGAIQAGKYVANLIKSEIKGQSIQQRPAFRFQNRGSLAIVSRFSAVGQVGKFQVSGFPAWCIWLILHLVYLVEFKSKLSTLLAWIVTFWSLQRGQLTITEQQAYARTRLEQLQKLSAEQQHGFVSYS